MSAVTQLGEFCEVTYGVPRLQARILVSAYLPTRYWPVWYMIDAEKCEFLKHLEYSVMKLEHSAILDTYYLRDMRGHFVNKYVDVLVTAREKVQLFANRHYDWPGPFINTRSRYPLVAAECLRVRLEYDSSKQPGNLACEEMFHLVRHALAEASIEHGGIVPAPLDEVFHRRASLFRMIDKHLTSSVALMRNFGFVPVNHAAICGRKAPNEEDMAVQRYVMRMTVPIWVDPIIQVFLERGPKRALTWKEVLYRTGQIDKFQWRYGGININRPPQVGQKIIEDLWKFGLIRKNHYGRFVLKAEYADDLHHILEARA